MSYTLHTPAGNLRAFKALIAAEYNTISVNTPEFDASLVSSLSPNKKAPILQTPSGNVIFESNAIARYLAKIRRDTGLAGESVLEEASIDSWVEWSANELELPCCVWFYPVAGYMPFHPDAYTKAKADVGKALEVLDAHLSDKTYIVGERITLADICLASTLVYPFKLVCDKTFLKAYGNVSRWFQTCVNQPQFKAVIGTVTLCKKELTAPGQTLPKAAKKDKKDAPKKEKKDKKEAAPAAPAPAKKTEHPYKIMDKEAKSPFSMDAWKKMYSNCSTYDEGMKYFWEKFDASGWSIWHQMYNYNEDNKRTFMTSNAVGGFQQRTDEIRKWAFGCMWVLGTEETVLEIQGMWLLRGDTVQHMIDANDDANWYTWTKVAGPGVDLSEDVKERIKEYWVSETTVDGKEVQDCKVFK